MARRLRRGPIVDQLGGDGCRVRSVRVMPCLDVDVGRVVKGARFVDLVGASDPAELAARYDAEAADELVFVDITASADARETMVEVTRRTAEEVFISFTVGGELAAESGTVRGRRHRRPPLGRRLRSLHPRRPAADGARRGGVGGRVRAPGGGGDPAHVDGSRRHARRFTTWS